MNTFSSWLAIAIISGFLFPFAAPVQARSEYNRAFWTVYQQELGKYAETTKCSVCHFGNDKKDRNDYGRAFGKTLGNAQIKDADKIQAALQVVAQEKSSTVGKTFGDLIRAGKLPGKRPQ